jgi:hypothetical protein
MVRLCAAAFSGLAKEDAQDNHQGAENEKDREQKPLSRAVLQRDATHDVLEVRSI